MQVTSRGEIMHIPETRSSALEHRVWGKEKIGDRDRDRAKAQSLKVLANSEGFSRRLPSSE